MDSVSFTSKIRLLPLNEFNNITRTMGSKKLVDSPWTIKESVLSDTAYTKNIMDCSICGLTDGAKVLLLHICPTNPKNKCFTKIEEFIRNKINLNDINLQGFILGSKKNNIYSPNSTKLFDKFVEFMQKYEIPFSQFKGGSFVNNVAYSSQKDEWIIGNGFVSNILKKNYEKEPMMLFNMIFDEVKVSNLDEIGF